MTSEVKDLYPLEAKDEPRVALLMRATVDAYMRGLLEDEAWEMRVRDLISNGYADLEIVWILNSKHTRWADDVAELLVEYLCDRKLLPGSDALRRQMLA